MAERVVVTVVFKLSSPRLILKLGVEPIVGKTPQCNHALTHSLPSFVQISTY